MGMPRALKKVEWPSLNALLWRIEVNSRKIENSRMEDRRTDMEHEESVLTTEGAALRLE